MQWKGVKEKSKKRLKSQIDCITLIHMAFNMQRQKQKAVIAQEGIHNERIINYLGQMASDRRLQ